MIYTVTLNPSIDYIVRLDEMNLGSVNRIQEDLKLPGGKGINVSRILKQLDIASTAIGYLGGFTGGYIEDWLSEEGIDTAFTTVNDTTRINVKVKAGVETELNGAGPRVSAEEQAAFEATFSKLTSADVVILSGSKPPSLPVDYYQQLIRLIQAQGARFVIDTTGEELVKALADHPLVVKPNHHELADIYGFEAERKEDLIPYGRKLLAEGASFAIVSMAGEGALFFTEDAVYHGWSPKGEVKNSVGSGDSMIAGFVGTYLKTQDTLKAFRVSLACGSATAFSDDLAQKEKIESLLPEITIQKLEE
ncbi:1-phosphofructokinase [Jeotgalibaca caeni]|uniref:1-phosphofructokinase n=1 Tax=Jeotgalibaca caeni TaxID=3028623 RepID=UPI00237DCA14|nr:1-phosphofructokinase [Jeotgalibaca caeni]MDE1548734.1 1-phosphofructokinase [Jeotgalibaca caeni]